MTVQPILQVMILASLFFYSTASAQETGAAQATPALVKTYTASKTLELNDEVASFVIDLIHKNTAGVQDQYRKLTAKTEEDAGGRYSTRRFQGLQWFVNEFTHEESEKGMSESADYIYLVRQQLIFGYHYGYSAPVNVVARVRVQTERRSKRVVKATKPDLVQPGTKITLAFEGFLTTVPVAQQD
jgi:hypothetical protein